MQCKSCGQELHDRSREASVEAHQEDRILREPEVLRLLGLSRATLRRLELDGRLGKRIQIGVRAVGWKSSSIMAFINSRESAK
jgi:predicted DNA-binding transcriptional regulator AlpA